MKTKVCAIFMVIATVALITISCDKEKKVITLNETIVSDTTLSRNLPMEEFYNLDLEGKKSFAERYRKQITYNAWEKSYVRDENSLTILIASGTALNVVGADKKICDAKFNDELVVISSGLSTPDTMLVRNGTSCSIQFTNKTEVGHGSPWRFQISNTQKLKDFLSSIQEWDMIVKESAYSMPGLGKDENFSTFLTQNESFLKEGDKIDCFDRRVIDERDVVNFKKRERLKKK